MSLAIDYRVLKAGWAECTVHVGEEKFELSASYLSDALGNLVLGESGYRERWLEHEFPKKQLELLTEYIARWRVDG